MKVSLNRSLYVSRDRQILTLSWATMTAPRLPRIFVPAGMIGVPVRVDHEPHRIRIEGRDRGRDLIGERRMVVDQDIAVFAVAEADVSAGAEQDGHTWRKLLDLDLDLRPVALLGGRRRSDEQ